MSEPKEYSQENLVKWRDEMLALGRGTAPPDKAATEIAIDKVYKERGLEPPKHKHWAISPKAGLELVNELCGTKKTWYSPVYGGLELYWVGHWCFVKTELKLESEADPFPQLELIRACGGLYWPFENGVVFTERPSLLKLDNEGRYHAERGPAIAWRDGESMHFWHGTAIPSEWVENPPETLDPALALNWENIEQRRCLAEIIGWNRILEKLNPEVINEDEPEIGTLLRVDLPGSGKEQFLKVRCGTGRTFVLPVPPDMKTALEANAWTYNLAPDDWNVTLRT